MGYYTQREQAYDSASSRADRIRKRLGWEPGILNGCGGRPKGMHWATFMRLKARHDTNVTESLTGMAVKFGLVMDRPTGIIKRLGHSDSGMSRRVLPRMHDK